MNILNEGASGYFSRPQHILDPQLFDGTELKPSVREQILEPFFSHMETMTKNPRNWIMLWLAGSGITYQWAANRGNGDLDVMLGFDFGKFVTDNPDYGYMSREEIASSIDSMLKKHLWPKTAHTVFEPGGRAYEVTYYLNPVVENFDESINNIHPYAAYNLSEGHWTVEPMKDSGFPKAFPTDFERVATENRETAEQLVSRYKYLQSQLGTTYPNSPQFHNLSASKKLLVQHIKTMYDTIHLGRQQAFTATGEGFGDFYNFQWQAAKRDGIISSFNEILNKEN